MTVRRMPEQHPVMYLAKHYLLESMDTLFGHAHAPDDEWVNRQKLMEIVEVMLGAAYSVGYSDVTSQLTEVAMTPPENAWPDLVKIAQNIVEDIDEQA